MLEDIKTQNGFFDDMEKVENFINNCLNNQTDFNTDFKKTKTFFLKFTYNNSVGIKMELQFELLPIRKDISNNQEILELKRKIKKLESKISKYSFIDSFYYHPNLYELIPYNWHETICFSTVSDKQLYLRPDRQHSSPINISHKLTNNTLYSSYNISIINYKVWDDTSDLMTSDFKKIKCDTLILYKLKHIHFENLGDTIKTLILIECTCENFNSYENKSINKIILSSCVIDNLDNLKNVSTLLNIEIYGSRPKYNGSSFGSNITINTH
ncbi:hypothetical protein crov533 [Cafeteria roenbergensis virus]|uniref:Uncharacterized protein n=1 Tax=Cafeteria roenbergensis virus (strain BV-PW1) TaxID=693272 RepID=E3T5V4_CROVB|nr:hypothetical protein crov533 [Cafeteria roenbergensis virus BV-PW1]ADO67567.1 hypothetical protein crov533 [Cafeteria roenbergensis virus BV-PW1]